MSNSLPLADLGNVPAVKLETVGDKVSGRIVRVARQQQRDFDTGAPMVWSDGNPRLQTVIVLDVNGEERALYAKGGNYDVVSGTGLSMESAIVAAVREAGGASIDAGAELAVAHSGLGKPPRAGANAPKLYTAQYRPATASANVSDLFTS